MQVTVIKEIKTNVLIALHSFLQKFLPLLIWNSTCRCRCCRNTRNTFITRLPICFLSFLTVRFWLETCTYISFSEGTAGVGRHTVFLEASITMCTPSHLTEQELPNFLYRRLHSASWGANRSIYSAFKLGKLIIQEPLHFQNKDSFINVILL